MVPFQTFWARFKAELNQLPIHQGAHYGSVRKWSQYRGDLGEEFVFFFTGGDVVNCGTASTANVRSVSSVEFKKVYSVWEGYRSGEIPRTHIMQDLGVQNASWIIPLLKRYEYLMD